MNAAIKTSFEVTGMHCAACAKRVETTLARQKGVQQAAVNFLNKHAEIEYDPEIIKLAEIKQAVQKSGYDININQHTLPVQHQISATSSFWADKSIWRRASFNTLNCLLGCSIGDFSAVVIMQGFFPGTAMSVQMTVAIVAGIFTSVTLETFILRIREKFDWQKAFTTAISMSFLSMLVMEAAMNTSDFMITGGKSAFTKPTYWIAFAIAASAGFLAAVPYNYYKLKKHNKACH